MKKSNFLLPVLLLLAAGLSLSACGKKDSSFAARYTQNAMGANGIDPAQNQIAAESAAAAGYELDVVGISGVSYSDGRIKITSKIMVNNKVQDISTVHNGTNIVEGSLNLEGLDLKVIAMCADTSCEPYYLMISGYKGQTEIIQEGIKKHFKTTGNDRYQWIQAGKFLNFQSASNASSSGMVSLLNSK